MFTFLSKTAVSNELNRIEEIFRFESKYHLLNTFRSVLVFFL